MKLIYLHQYFKFPKEAGGTRSYDLAKSFLKHDVDVVIVTSTSDIKYKTKKRWVIIEDEGLVIHYIYIPYNNKFSYFKRIESFLKFIWFSCFHIVKIKADVVLATSTPLTIGLPALIKRWFSKTPFIFEVRDVWPEAVIAIGAINNVCVKKILYWFEYIIYKNAFTIVPLSNDMQKSIVNRYPVYAHKTDIVIENISEVNRFQSADKVYLVENILNLKPRFIVLYAGTFGLVNGLHKVVELAEKTLQIDKELVYVLLGDGSEKEKIIQLAQDKKILNINFCILDSVPKADLPIWYNTASMGSSFVINIEELWANSANKFFDTLAAGRPILINHLGWQAEVIRKYNVGFVLPHVITDEVALQFVEYSKSKETQLLQKKKALILAKEEYSLEKATQKYLKIFARVSSNFSDFTKKSIMK
ncbi:MAG: glycosyltransferase family 4 protein [Oceanicaulis sp.]|nr:glycosyltransferase family 4 protein [Oceanicaulis sp.]